MKFITKTLFKLILLFSLINCSSDDKDIEVSNDISTPENLVELLETEWVYSDNGSPIFIYLGSPSNSALVIGSENVSQGTHSYQKPNFNLDFDVKCDVENTEHIFSSCSVSGVIEGDKLIINDNGTEYIFIRIFEDIQEDNTFGPEGMNTIHPELLGSWKTELRLGGINGTETITFKSNFEYEVNLNSEEVNPAVTKDGNPFRCSDYSGEYWFSKSNTQRLSYTIGSDNRIISTQWSIENNSLLFEGRNYRKQ